MTQWQSRIVGHGKVRVDQVLFNPDNWRIHPKLQKDSLRAAIGNVGYIRSVTINQVTGHLLDGHLRVQLADEMDVEEIDAEFVEMTPEQERLAIVSLDPLSAMAAADRDKLAELMRSIETDDAEVRRMLEAIAADNRIELLPPQEAPEPQLDKADELQQKCLAICQWAKEAGLTAVCESVQ